MLVIENIHMQELEYSKLYLQCPTPWSILEPWYLRIKMISTHGVRGAYTKKTHRMTGRGCCSWTPEAPPQKGSFHEESKVEGSYHLDSVKQIPHHLPSPCVSMPWPFHWYLFL